MIAEIRRHLHAAPFEPFSIVTSAGNRYDIPSPDHAGINPSGSRVIVWFDDESSVTISGLHIAAIDKRGEAAKKSGAK